MKTVTKTIKIGKFNLNVTLEGCKNVRFFKERWDGVKIQDLTLDELINLSNDSKEMWKNTNIWSQTIGYRTTSFNTIRIYDALIDIMKNGVQSKNVIIR